MDQFTSAQAPATSTQPQPPDFSVERQALLKELRDRDDRAYEARMLLDLLMWIENAREVIEKVQFVATYNAEVRKALSDLEISYGLPWDESDGLCRVARLVP